MNQETRFSSMWVVAQQGSGKTHLLKYMLSQDLGRDCSIVVMDSKGELTNAVRNLNLGDRLIVFDPDEPFPINPFDVSRSDEVISHLGYMLGGLVETTISPKQRTFFETLVDALLYFDDPSLPLLWEILTKGPKAFQTQIAALPEDKQNFFNYEWKTYAETATEMQWRLRALFTREIFRTMFAAKKTRFHIGDAMNQGKLIVIDNSQAKCTKEGCGFIGRLFVSQIWSAGIARQLMSDHLKKPTFVYIDEAHVVIKKDNKIADIIDELRSQRIGLVLAHQRVRQIEESNVRSALENCAIKMVSPNPGDDSEYFSRLLDIPRERLINLPRGRFATHVRFEGSSIVDVPPTTISIPTMTDEQQRAFRVRMREKFGFNPDGVVHSSKPAPIRAQQTTEAAGDFSDEL